MSGVLITGATSGIGRQLAQDYASAGESVLACGRNEAELQQLQHQFPAITPVNFDVTDRVRTHQTLAALPWIPSLWILNAGICEYIDDGVLDSAVVARVMAVNFQGVVNCLDAIQPHLQPGHRVAVISSIAGELALPRAEAYGASKAAISYLVRALSVDWMSRGIALSLIYPGFVATPLTDKNTFSMPMIISVKQASAGIRRGLARGQSHIYVPRGFTTIIRLLAWLPYGWQQRLVKHLVQPAECQQ